MLRAETELMQKQDMKTRIHKVYKEENKKTE